MYNFNVYMCDGGVYMQSKTRKKKPLSTPTFIQQINKQHRIEF